MSETSTSKEEYDRPALYEIRIKGHLDARWAGRFEGLTLSREANDETRLAGPITDQAALYGVLRAVRDLGMPLLSVARIEPEQPGARPVGLDTQHDLIGKVNQP